MMFLLAIGLLFTTHSVLAGCPSGPDRNLILTEGVAEITGQNDSARISVAVLTEGRDLEKASSENAAKTESVLKSLKDLNISNLKLETSHYRVTPQKDYDVRPPKIKGYEVHNAVEITLERFEPEELSRLVSRVVGKALGSGANSINHIQFYIENKRPLEDKALAEATHEAIGRAETMARAAGVKLKRIVSLSTHPGPTPPKPNLFRAASMKMEDQAMAPPIETGESTIRVQVSLAYEIE
jgi:uncharacterized protein YggE